jgi:hypothetical protein
MALRNPLRFAQWVNDQRCSLTIENDPSGVWHVRIGCCVAESTSRSLGEAMCHQFWMLELHPDWIWTSDYLESVNPEVSGRPAGSTDQTSERPGR